MGLWGAIAAALGLGREAVEARGRLKVAKIEARAKIEESRATAALRAAEHDAAWETLALSDAASSWKDEWWTILLAIPLILAFVPGLPPYIEAGFAALDETPDWYRWALLAAISFAFGRRVMPQIGGAGKRKHENG
ncbi:hypothetical protein [Tateyamaria sp.]|uniref:hypothetical protein n=1 Tax=Tateyamaria sp. TaxID=1929288 RepID=UPI003B21D501